MNKQFDSTWLVGGLCVFLAAMMGYGFVYLNGGWGSKPQPEQAKREIASENAIASYRSRLSEIDPDGSLIVGAELSPVPGEVVITVGDSWHREAKQNRLQAAQNLWKIWAHVSNPDNPDKARIKIVDMNGNRVGGSGALGGSFISVQD